MVRLIALLFPLLTLFLVSDMIPFTARITMLRGEVTVSIDGNTYEKATEGQTLPADFSLRTGENGKVTLLFNDGNIRFVTSNTTWAMKSNATTAKESHQQSTKVLAAIISDGASALNYDTITGLRTVFKNDVESDEDGETILEESDEDSSIVVAAAPPKPYKRMDKKTENIQGLSSSSGKKKEVPTARTPASSKPASDKELLNRSRLQTVPQTVPPEGGGTIDIYAQNAFIDHSAFLPNPQSRFSKKFSSFILPDSLGQREILLTISQNNVILVEEKTLFHPSDPIYCKNFSDSLSKTGIFQYNITVTDPRGSIEGVTQSISFQTLTETAEIQLAKEIAALETLPNDTDQQTKLYLKIRIFLRHQVLDQALLLLQKLTHGRTESLPHLRSPLAKIYDLLKLTEAAEKQRQLINQ